MSAKPLLILLADDDQEDLELIEEVILQIEPKAQVRAVTNGKEVMDFLATCSINELPHLLILDYNMPQMTGAEVLTRLSSENRYHSVIKLVLSTSGSRAHIKECLNNGAMDYFVKPGNIKELKALFKKILLMYAPS